MSSKITLLLAAALVVVGLVQEAQALPPESRNVARTPLPQPTAKSSAVCWDKQNNFYGWRADRNITCTQQGETLKITLGAADGRLINDTVNFDPSSYAIFSFRYRATDIKNKTGRLYFAKNGRNFAARDYWKLPPLPGDGQWHTVKVSAAQIATPENWFQGGKITKLRWDIPSETPGELEISEIRFERMDDTSQLPLPQVRLQLDAQPWKKVAPRFEATPVIKVEGAYFQGKMIREVNDLSPEQSVLMRKKQIPHPYRDFFVRREFTLKAEPVQAVLQFVADDSAQVYLNGEIAGAVKSWSDPVEIDVRKFLHPGKNILGFHYRNSGGAGGVLAEIFIRYADGSSERINTDETFVGTVSPADNWVDGNADPSGFKPVVAQAAPPSPPWTQKLPYHDYSTPQKLLKYILSPQKATAGETVKLQIDLEGDIPVCPFYGTVRLMHGKHLLWSEELAVTSEMTRKLDEKKWRLTIDYPLPLYMNSNQATLEFDSTSLYFADNSKIAAELDLQRPASIPGWGHAPVCQVKTGKYGPYFELNGKPFYHVAGRPGTFTLPDPPTNVVNVSPAWWEWWTPDGELVFEAFDQAAEKARREEGDNWFIWDLTLFIPRAWLQSHPEEICRDDQGETVRDGYASKRDSHSFASAAALAEMRSALLKALAYLESSPYANRIIGYRINGGHTIEWLGWNAPKGRVLDFSNVAQTRFTEFAKQHYPILQDTAIPTKAEREASDGDELVRDPEKHLKAIAYNDFYSTMVVDYIIDLCSAAKKFLNNRKLVGTYYGYTMTLNCDSVSQMRAHYALRKLLDASCVDFLMSPHPYNVRNFGDTYGDMKPFATMKQYQIVPLHEDDTRTHMGGGHGRNYQAPNAELCTEILRRGMGFNLCRNMPCLFIPMPGNYEFPEARRDFKTLETVGQHCLDKQIGRHAEIALVASEKSIIYSPAKSTVIKTGAIQQNYNIDGTIGNRPVRGAAFAASSFGENYTTWARLGAPIDYLLAEDLTKNPGDYKIYVFINCTVYDEKFLEAVEKLRRKNCMLVWMYAPGYTFNNRNSVENMKRLTGLDFSKIPVPLIPAVKMDDGRWVGSPTVRLAPLFTVTTPGVKVSGRYENGSAGLIKTRTGQATTVFCGVWRPDLKLLRTLVDDAGVKCYSESGDPLEANDALIALHARSAGDKTIQLNRKADVLDVFNKKIIARGTNRFTVSAKLHESLLFYYGDDADVLLKKLEGRK